MSDEQKHVKKTLKELETLYKEAQEKWREYKKTKPNPDDWSYKTEEFQNLVKTSKEYGEAIIKEQVGENNANEKLTKEPEETKKTGPQGKIK